MSGAATRFVEPWVWRASYGVDGAHDAPANGGLADALRDVHLPRPGPCCQLMWRLASPSIGRPSPTSARRSSCGRSPNAVPRRADPAPSSDDSGHQVGSRPARQGPLQVLRAGDDRLPDDEASSDSRSALRPKAPRSGPTARRSRARGRDRHPLPALRQPLAPGCTPPAGLTARRWRNMGSRCQRSPGGALESATSTSRSMAKPAAARPSA